MLKQTLPVICLCITTLSANAALYDRGNGMIYDDVLNITWLQDANYAYTSGYALANALGEEESSNTNIQADGRMGWVAAKAWAAQLNYGGFDDWRLPTANLLNASDPCESYDGRCDMGFNNTISELGHMFYNNLANLGLYDIAGNDRASGYGITNSSFTDGIDGITVSFLNLQNDDYWLGDDYALDAESAWAFSADIGFQDDDDYEESQFSWAVRDGDVSAVPVPAAGWLFGSALVGLAGVKRRKTHNSVYSKRLNLLVRTVKNVNKIFF